MSNRRRQQLLSLAKEMKDFPKQIQLISVSITETEMQFRSLPHRIGEYFYVCILLILGKDASAVSIGISQISIRHYVALEGVTQIRSLMLSMSAKENLKACCKLVQAANCGSLDDICSMYNGKSTWFYRNALKKNYALVRELDAASRK